MHVAPKQSVKSLSNQMERWKALEIKCEDLKNKIASLFAALINIQYANSAAA